MSNERSPWPGVPLPPSLNTPIVIRLTAENGVKFLANEDSIVVWPTGEMARQNEDGRGQICLETADEIAALADAARQRVLAFTAGQMRRSGDRELG
jgi:hypothetical protein